MEKICFAENHDEMHSKMLDLFNHYNDEVHKRNLGAYDHSHTLKEKQENVDKLMMAEIQKLSGISMTGNFVSPQMVASNPSVQWAAMAVLNTMIDYIIPDVLVKDTGMYADVLSGDFGTSFSFNVKPSDLFTVTKAGRTKRNAEVQKEFSGTVTIVPVNHQITVGTNLYRRLCGLDSMSEFAIKAILSIEAEMRVEAYNLLNATMTALTTTPANQSFNVAGFTKASAIRLAQLVQVYNGGAEPMFVGTRAALAGITADTATFRYDENSALFKLGHFRNYAGYDIFEMEQVAKWNDKYDLALDDTKIFLVSPAVQKLIKICYEGSQITANMGNFDYADEQQTMTVNKAWGMGVATNAFGGVITLA